MKNIKLKWLLVIFAMVIATGQMASSSIHRNDDDLVLNPNKKIRPYVKLTHYMDGKNSKVVVDSYIDRSLKSCFKIIIDRSAGTCSVEDL